LTNLYAPIFLRAALQVSLVACNVVNIARGKYLWAFATGFAISYVWWRNSRTAAFSEAPHGQVVYATGAGTGTVIGMIVGKLL
jgi:hypothetical protein